MGDRDDQVGLEPGFLPIEGDCSLGGQGSVEVWVQREVECAVGQGSAIPRSFRLPPATSGFVDISMWSRSDN